MTGKKKRIEEDWYDMTVDFSSEIMEGIKNNIFQVMNRKNCHPVNSISSKIPLTNEGEIKTFSDEEKLRENLLSVD